MALRTHQGGRARGRERHPGAGRRSHAAVVPRAGAGGRVHERHGDRGRRAAGIRSRSRWRSRRSWGRCWTSWWARPIRSTDGARRSTTRCRPAGSGRSKWRSPRRTRRTRRARPGDDRRCHRPGFVLEVDERTPPLLVHQGEGFRMQKFPLGHARGVPAGRAAGHPRRGRRGAATRCCIRWATRSRCPSCCSPGMKLTIAIDDISIPLPPMRTPDVRQRDPGAGDRARGAQRAWRTSS